MSDAAELHALLAGSPRERRRAARRASSPEGVFALRSVLLGDPSARVRAIAARRLGDLGSPLARPWLARALADPSPLVRLSVCRALARFEGDPDQRLALVLGEDPRWWVRRAAAFALAASAGACAAGALRLALADPVWRVRLAALRALGALAVDPAARERILAPLEGAPLRAVLALAYLRAALEGAGPQLRSLAPASPEAGPLDDPDPAVVTARLLDAPPGSVNAAMLVRLLAEPHAPLRALAVRRLIERGCPEELREALGWLDDPRVPHAAEAALRVAEGVGRAADDAAGAILASDDPPPRKAWARKRLRLEGDDERPAPPLGELALPTLEDPWTRAASLDEASAGVAVVSDPDPWVRRSAARLLGGALRDPASRGALGLELAASPDPWLRLQAALWVGRSSDASLAALLELSADRDLCVRAAASDALDACPSLGARLERLRGEGRLSSAAGRAALTRLVGHLGRVDLISGPSGGDSDGAHHALLREVFGQGACLAPGSRALASPAPRSSPAARSTGSPLLARAALGPVLASRLAISGRFEPPVEALEEAREAGARAYFWEPPYQNLTRFLRRAPRDGRTIIAGSYHADGASIRGDVERALRLLRTDTLEVFLLFWARSAARLDDRALSVMRALRESGKVRAVGFSTHLRELAVGAMEAGGWDVIMTRHSAAHRGAERQVLPRARALGVGVISFGALCHGRLLAKVARSETAPAPAADCYRYSLETPGVSICLSAPRTRRELRHNLAALREPALGAEDRARLLAHGEAVYDESQRFNALVRQAPGPVRQAARSIALDFLDAPPDPPRAPVDVEDAPGPRVRYDEGTPVPPWR